MYTPRLLLALLLCFMRVEAHGVYILCYFVRKSVGDIFIRARWLLCESEYIYVLKEYMMLASRGGKSFCVSVIDVLFMNLVSCVYIYYFTDDYITIYILRVI